jgi:hypothetical protein
MSLALNAVAPRQVYKVSLARVIRKQACIASLRDVAQNVIALVPSDVTSV